MASAKVRPPLITVTIVYMTFGTATILEFYRRVMCRKSLYRLNKALYFASLRGMGIGNWQTQEISGERNFIRSFAGYFESPVILDIGANVGNYSRLIREFNADAVIHAFEPHPETFKQLKSVSKQLNVQAFNCAVSDIAGMQKLFDYVPVEGSHGSEHASLLQNVIENMHGAESASWDVETTTVDQFVEQQAIRHINLIKIDVEGNELRVLQGATKTIGKNMVDLIQFEFNETSMIDRVFLKDFYELLPNYDFFRMLPDGLVAMGSYVTLLSEIFAYQNIVAQRKDLKCWF